jgi:exodeoxyribonuclease-1
MNKYKKGNKTPTFYFHDYETFGLDPKRSKASQFAGIRTDENLNILPDGENDKLNIYCEITPDYLPSPEACLVTMQTPLRINKIKEKEIADNVDYKKRVVMNEDKFAKTVFEVMSKSMTCNIGYNSINFDDEVSRNLFYRTLRDPYQREWKFGCSRGEGMNFVLFSYIVDPTVLIFPQAKDRETGELLFAKNGRPLPSFKLEELSSANGIIHENAHDALSDVYALIGVLKLIKDRRPDIFDYIHEMRTKKAVDKFMTENANSPLLHVSTFYGKENYSMGVVKEVCKNPTNPSAKVMVDLNTNPKDLIEESAEELGKKLYMKKAELEEKKLIRPPFKGLVMNKCPIIAKLSWIKDKAGELGLSGALIRENKSIVDENFEVIQEKAKVIFGEQDYPEESDVDLLIYDGFASKKDQSEMEAMHKSLQRGELAGVNFNPDSEKFKKVFFRFKARNYPDNLGVKETSQWAKFCVDRLSNPDSPAEYNIDQYLDTIDNLRIVHKLDKEKLTILDELIIYAKEVLPKHPRVSIL